METCQKCFSIEVTQGEYNCGGAPTDPALITWFYNGGLYPFFTGFGGPVLGWNMTAGNFGEASAAICNPTASVVNVSLNASATTNNCGVFPGFILTYQADGPPTGLISIGCPDTDSPSVVIPIAPFSVLIVAVFPTATNCDCSGSASLS